MPQTTMELQPDPERVIEGLRDTGYEFNTAIADLVDNCIAAEASRIEINLDVDFRDQIRLSIADNGQGMDRVGLQDAMRYGSKKRSSPASLGKYGLGLKTASSAFARRLSVISRPDGKTQPLMATWDLDHVARVKKWEVLLNDGCDPEAVERLNSIAANRSGTVVVWEQVDRLIKSSDSKSVNIRKQLKNRESALRLHIATVYQRFLDPLDDRAGNVSIHVNGKAVEAWDPFQLEYSELLQKEEVKVEWDGKSAKFLIRAYVLPRREEFPTEEAAKEALLTNDRQGIYIYRENRLIHEASWLGLFQKEPHISLLRVEFSFDHRLDDAFHLDIKKSQIILNDDLAIWLQTQFLPAPRREANKRSRDGYQKNLNKQARNAHQASNAGILSKEKAGSGASVTVIDAGKGLTEVKNKHGSTRLKLAIAQPRTPGEVVVQPVDGINNGMLFQPAFIDQHKAVQINTSHPYYHKVYVPNLNRTVTLQGLDSLLWALSVAELSTVQEETAGAFQDMRYEISRILEKLVESLPDAEPPGGN